MNTSDRTSLSAGRTALSVTGQALVGAGRMIAWLLGALVVVLWWAFVAYVTLLVACMVIAFKIVMTALAILGGVSLLR